MPRRTPSTNQLVPTELVERRILLLRGHKVMLDRHLAEMYEVPTFRLNEAVKRNRRRFPEDFMFPLTKTEAASLTSQLAMSKPTRGGRRTLPYVFTEQGVAMLSTVLKSERAIAVNIAIMRAFVRLRQILATHKETRRTAGRHGKEARQAVQSSLRDSAPAYGPATSAFKTPHRIRGAGAIVGTRLYGYAARTFSPSCRCEVGMARLCRRMRTRERRFAAVAALLRAI